MKIKAFILINIIFIIMTAKFAFGMEMVKLSLVYDGKTHEYSAEPVYLMLNGQKLDNLPMPPIILQNYTFMPTREVFESLGAIVDWNNARQEVYIAYEKNMIVLQIDNKFANVNGNSVEMDVPPKIINNKTMIPIRFAAEALGLNVGWDAKQRLASVSTIEYLRSNTESISYMAPNDGALASSAVPSEAGSGKPAVYSVSLPNGLDSSFTINATAGIERIDHFIIDDDRLVIDIYNTEMKVEEKTISVFHNIVKSIRIAQNQVTPEMITRVVFDLDLSGEKNEYSAVLSSDKKSVVVSFEKNNIKNIDFYSDGTSDYLKIEGDIRISPAISRLVLPMRLIVDIPNATLQIPEKMFDNGRYVKAVRYSQFTPDTVRVVLELDNNFNYKLNENGNSLEINITDVTFRNITYDSQNKRFVITKDASYPIDINNISLKEQILKNQYILNFNCNLEGLLGFGEYVILDDFYKSLNIQTTSLNTSIIFDEKQVFEYIVTEDEINVYINFMNPKDKYSRIVVLDAGHGGKDPGASDYGLSEKDLTLDIVLRAKALLEQDGRFKVYTTRDSDIYPTLSERTAVSNTRGDLFISVHINSADTNKNANGTEVYYLNPNNAVTGLTSKILAETLQKNLVNELNSNDRKIKTANFQVLRESEIPAALVEVGFISNYEEANKLASAEYRQKAAVALYNSIIELFERYPRN